MRCTSNKRGFTLVEAALAIALVGMALTATLQILQASKLSAAHTRDQKTARVLALKTLGEIESGIRWDELDEGALLSGSYAEDDYPAFYWELAVGDQQFSIQEDVDPYGPIDNWALRRERDEYLEANEDEDLGGEESAKPYEKIRIRVTYPKYSDLENELTLERWIRWDQVYRPEEGEDGEEAAPADAGGPDGNGGGGAGGAGASPIAGEPR
ncbi:MAG TPA: type II secretion system protein [Planctomycetes bacterium]|nr:type II secretion system protein [Planctomycetota bacterium]HIK59815.1 type II secretion system protein [Planctomycetota bacterium]